MEPQSPKTQPYSVVEDQSEIIAFLSDPESYDIPCKVVEKIETHGALVFLVGDEVYKIKKAVWFPYMDFSSLERREKACRNELKINKPNADDIYLNVVPITRDSSGELCINGKGTPLEWAVHMRRFGQEHILSSLAESGKITDCMVKRLAAGIATYHEQAAIYYKADAVQKILDIISNLENAFAQIPHIIIPDQSALFATLAKDYLSKVESCLQHRSEKGFIRRCHGDLHLKNIVEVNDKPILFDAIEFDDDLATIDILYDLAFLLMDLMERGLQREANLLLNRYLHYSHQSNNLYALQALPLFLACRAGIRAMVTGQYIAQKEGEDNSSLVDTVQHYFRLALSYLDLTGPRLICVGGLSGTGKSTLAAHLAPSIGSAPGALHLRSDLERKSLFAIDETEHLEPQLYSPVINAKVYEFLLQQAGIALKSGHSVILDAVYSLPEERMAAQQLAKDLNIPFTGIWLTVSQSLSISRVAQRVGDASDATPEVVEKQYKRDLGPIEWHQIDASGSETETVIEALKVIEQGTA